MMDLIETLFYFSLNKMKTDEMHYMHVLALVFTIMFLVVLIRQTVLYEKHKDDPYHEVKNPMVGWIIFIVAIVVIVGLMKFFTH